MWSKHLKVSPSPSDVLILVPCHQLLSPLRDALRHGRENYLDEQISDTTQTQSLRGMRWHRRNPTSSVPTSVTPSISTLRMTEMGVLAEIMSTGETSSEYRQCLRQHVTNRLRSVLYCSPLGV
jgi:hypothetical protein